MVTSFVLFHLYLKVTALCSFFSSVQIEIENVFIRVYSVKYFTIWSLRAHDGNVLYFYSTISWFHVIGPQCMIYVSFFLFSVCYWNKWRHDVVDLSVLFLFRFSFLFFIFLTSSLWLEFSALLSIIRLRCCELVTWS